MRTVSTFDEVRALCEGRIGLVPTMGFFHEGHLSLIEAACKESDTVVVTIFVNPLQFHETSDLDTYPRDLDRDVTLAETAGCDVLFVPEVSTMFGTIPVTRIEVAGVADGMEGAARPGHFAGVATLVAKLFSAIRPDTAYFGRKDAQQLVVVRTMARDLSYSVEVRGMPIIRETDGLALSSRNVRLDAESRSAALALSDSLFAAADVFESGVRSSDTLIDVVRERLDTQDKVAVEYIEVANTSDAASVERMDRDVFLAIAGRVGGVRLIDNVHLDPGSGVADRGVRLGVPSILYGGT